MGTCRMTPLSCNLKDNTPQIDKRMRKGEEKKDCFIPKLLAFHRQCLAI